MLIQECERLNFAYTIVFHFFPCDTVVEHLHRGSMTEKMVLDTWLHTLTRVRAYCPVSFKKEEK